MTMLETARHNRAAMERLVYGEPTDLAFVRNLAREIGRQHFEARLAGDDEHEDDADRWEVDE